MIIRELPSLWRCEQLYSLYAQLVCKLSSCNNDIDAADISFAQVLDVLCSLCVCHGVAVRSNQHLICDNLLPGRDLLLQTRLINHVSRYTDTNTATYVNGTPCQLVARFLFSVCTFYFSSVECFFFFCHKWSISQQHAP